MKAYEKAQKIKNKNFHGTKIKTTDGSSEILKFDLDGGCTIKIDAYWIDEKRSREKILENKYYMKIGVICIYQLDDANEESKNT